MPMKVKEGLVQKVLSSIDRKVLFVKKNIPGNSLRNAQNNSTNKQKAKDIGFYSVTARSWQLAFICNFNDSAFYHIYPNYLQFLWTVVNNSKYKVTNYRPFYVFKTNYGWFEDVKVSNKANLDKTNLQCIQSRNSTSLLALGHKAGSSAVIMTTN